MKRGVLVSITLGLFLGGCSRKPETPRHLVLVTIDTLRADRVGIYGATDVATPHLDRIAGEGAIAVRAMAHVPLTRPSHASLFTGMLPTRHGIRDNITPARLPDVPTLATVLKSSGFQTGAFVSAVVLAAGAGLERGFDLYSDEFADEETDAEEGPFLNELQRSGDETLLEAIGWLEENRDSRMFAWIHLYEPHDPYTPPEPYLNRYPDPYDGEVAWSDALVGRLEEALVKLGLRETTLLVVTSDHGEGLGEHGEALHGFFVYESTLAVPLLIRGPGVAPGVRIETLVQGVDLFPTTVEVLGIDLPASTDVSGRSFAAALRGKRLRGEPVAYAESLVPLLHFGWSDLRSIRRGKWKYIQAPRPELYDLEADPMELRNLVDSQPELALGMRGALGEELDRERAVDATETASVPKDLLDKLGALGYVGSGAPIESSTPGADPKDKIDEFRVANELIREGILLLHEGDFEGSVTRYRKLLTLEIESFEIHLNLGRGLLALARYDEAEPHFAEAARRLPNQAEAWEGWSQSLSARGDIAGALRTLKEAQAVIPDRASLHQREGAMLWRMGRRQEAREAYERSVAIDPDDPLLLARYGELLRDMGDIEASIERLREATKVAPTKAPYWNSLGMTLGGSGRLSEAEEAFRRASSLEPENARYAFNVGLVLMRQNRPSEARPFFERALQIEPGFEEARRYLAEASSAR
ncbi:MAG TPA: sulfatase-like hydrolase/transferase [Vicinamibacteria bacterium]|nr:sulfatase-like hydrolase/transferase [Vicinamibacteria bacterium]